MTSRSRMSTIGRRPCHPRAGVLPSRGGSFEAADRGFDVVRIGADDLVGPSVTVTGRLVLSRSGRGRLAPSSLPGFLRIGEHHPGIREQSQKVEIAERVGHTELGCHSSEAVRTALRFADGSGRRPEARGSGGPGLRRAWRADPRGRRCWGGAASGRRTRPARAPAGPVSSPGRALCAPGACRPRRCPRNGSVGGTPSRARFSSAEGSVVKSQWETESVRTRLISSGMSRSLERRPASTWATGMCNFTAARVAAIVEFTSPTTRTTSGSRSTSRSSIFIRPAPFDVRVFPSPHPDSRPALGSRDPRRRNPTSPCLVVASVDEDRLEAVRTPGELMHQRSDLHEVRARTGDAEDADLLVRRGGGGSHA